MQVFVTGASGHIEGSVANALRAAGHRVVGLVPRHTGRGENVWSNVHIDDLVDVYLHMLDQAPPGSFYVESDAGGGGGVGRGCRQLHHGLEQPGARRRRPPPHGQ